MQLPKGVEWAAHALVVLEVLGGSHPLSSAILAKTYDLSPSYLNKHLQKLAAAGLLRSTPGQSGGFTLTRPGSEITLADVVTALDGPAPLFHCTEIRCRGLFADRGEEFLARGPCGINAAMAGAERAWRDHLAGITIADLAAGIESRSRATLLALSTTTPGASS